MEKVLAALPELRETRWMNFMDELNCLARRAGLTEYTTYSRIWEYPWLWFHLQDLPRNARVLDIGSERSPFPWYLASQGFSVIVSDVTGHHWDTWKKASQRVEVRPRLRVLDSQNLALATGSVDVYLSVSVLEHVPNKQATLEEAARVLKPGGLLLMTFDICEPDMGMSFPEWNGRAVSMRELDQLFSGSSWFEPGLGDLRWNIGPISEYMAWVRTTAPHHNYACGAVAVRRNHQAWRGLSGKGRLMEARGTLSTIGLAVVTHVGSMVRRIKGKLPDPVCLTLRRVKSWISPSH